MEKVILCIAAASGLFTVSSLGERQYHVVSERKTWNEAQSYCREKYTDLVTIESMEDVNILNNMVNLKSYIYASWIGLHVEKWTWSLADEMFYSDGEAEFRNWNTGEPHDFTHNEYCAVSSNGVSWDDYPCESTFPSVCSDVRGQNVTFVYINIPMTWTEAQSYCRAHHTDLASVRNMTENQKVAKLIPSGQIAWIGLFRHLWWSDGRIYSFHYWDSITQRGAEESCVFANFYNSGKWVAVDCSNEHSFICYNQFSLPLLPSTAAQRHVIKIKLEVMEPNSNLDMDDSAVREGILQQLKQKLDQGGNKDIRLSWSKGSDGKVFHKVKKETRKKRSPKGEL